MPYSDVRCRPWILERLLERGLTGFTSVVDVGAGAGTWHDYLAEFTSKAVWTAVEVWEPYIDRFGLTAKYDSVVCADVRDLELPEADLCIFGDVLEHMPADDAVKVWDRARRVAKWLVINIPVLRYEQGALEGNPHECHLYHWDAAAVLERFSGIICSTGPVGDSVAGAFIAAGSGPGS